MLSKYKHYLMAFLGAILLISCEETTDIQEYGSISGIVLDASTDQPITGVSITTSPASSSVITGNDGRFDIQDVPIGEIVITTKKKNFKVSSVTIQVLPLKNSDVTVLIEYLNIETWASGKIVNPFPANESVSQETTDTLKWEINLHNPDFLDSLTYRVVMYESPDNGPLFDQSDLTDNLFVITDLKYNNTYYWQVSAIHKDSTIAQSEIWTFSTRSMPYGHVSFSRSVNNNYDIYINDTIDEKIHRITNSPSNIDWCSRVNRVTKEIAFISNRDLGLHIHTMDKEGNNVRKVTNVPIAGNYNPGYGFCWSPDGNRIVFPNHNLLYVVNKDGSGLSTIATAPENRHFTSCDWSGYTNKIVVQTTGNNPFDNELYIMNPDGSDMTLFVENLPGIIQNPVFSIDGQEIMFTRDAEGLNSWDGRQLDSRIYLKSINDTIELDLSITKQPGTNDLFPRFSPDGSKVICVNQNNTGYGQSNIVIMSINGLHRKILVEDAILPEFR